MLIFKNKTDIFKKEKKNENLTVMQQIKGMAEEQNIILKYTSRT